MIFDDGLAAIAVPILRRERAYGAVSLLWPKAYLRPDAFAAEHLDALRRTRDRISQDLERFDPRGGPDASGS